ncbi:hypothetical protein IQ06DRAFT_255258 [Phaeosphaeriaceae sp. SRC1lsM3a]|nr:hypothetical protein IQ06DRAFT_255258 [Stagonospora sp. SRC1lsM3a]
MSFRIAPLIRQRLFTTSSRARTALPMGDVATAQLATTAKAVPRLGRIARWYLPTMALIAGGMALTSRRTINTLDAANRHIGFGITNALNEANRKVHQALEPSQEEKNMALMEMYGERSTLEDMERAIAGIAAKAASPKDKRKILEEAYGDKSSLKDLERAMQIYEVQ